MSLPGGYTELEYIQSSGTQYVDTGLNPNQDFGVTIDFQMTTVSGWQCIFGAANSAQNADEYGVWHNGTNFGFYYASTNVTVSAEATARHLFVCSKNTITVDGAAAGSPAYTSFQTNYPLLLGAINYAGSKMYGSQIKIYSAKIYQNGTLVRNFIPCKNAAGVIGLWDDVNSVFYQNAGSGAFTAGPEVRGTHKTLIGGTAYEVKSGKCLINGTAYAIQKGRTLINGTGYDIALVSGTPISALPVGSTVKIAVNGTLRDFLVVNQGIPQSSSLYDDSCNGTWLLMKDCYEQRQWHSSDFNSYGDSSIHSYLNGTFLALVDSDVKSLIKQVKIPYRSGGGSTTNADSGASGLSAKIFLLSGVEVGLEGTGYLPYDGARLSYFNMSTGNDAKRVAYLNGSAATWWLRSPWCESGYDVAAAVETRGSYWRYLCTDATKSIRPAFVLPSETMVADDGTIVT